ncbi:alpha/beta fold hydrolase [Arhodomonas sp. AD133]|uniref:alpha/beta fold hydrolase n=1 Tax=Arhodomonas sp. AD133 TaxID=3415009 RepID=UPI003EBBF817
MTDDAIDLNYDASGDGPALLLLHGLYGSGNNWRRYARRWSEHYRVLLPDLRNHGRSPHSERMDYPAMAADLLRVLEREGLERATVLGHSMGGKVAMALALTAPQHVAGLIVADMAPVTYENRGHDAILAAMQAVDLDAVTSRADADAALAEAVDSPMVRQFLLTNLERGTEGWRWRLPLETLRQALPTIQGWPALDGRWEAPALFVHGERSDYVDAAGREAIASHFPEARVESIASAGHWLHVETPDAFTAAVERYLGD